MEFIILKHVMVGLHLDYLT